MISSLRTFFFVVIVVLIASATTACSSSSADKVDPFATVDDDEGDLLDEEPEVDEQARDRRRQAGRRVDESTYDVDEAAPRPARSIDARPDDWDLDDIRHFDGADHVIDGGHHWDGSQDASFAAAVEHDESHVYFWVEVTDDEVIASPPTDPLDAVIIRLRDPQLDDLMEALPGSLRDRLDVAAESAIAVTPDGDVALYDSSRTLEAGSVHAAGAETDSGYRIEAAVGLEALPYLAAMPLQNLAFRIDVYDTDDAARTSPETHLTATPGDAGESPRFAITETEGLRPATSPDGGPPRDDALGVWQLRDGHWVFGSLEYLSDRWEPIDDPIRVTEEAEDLGVLPDLCTRPERQMRVIEAYQEHTGDYRVALALCGTASTGDSCPGDATSQLVWTSLRAEPGDRWSVHEAFEVFDEPLEQCLKTAPPGRSTFYNFSLLPFDPIDLWVWGIGYHVRRDDSQRKIREASVAIVDPNASDFVLRNRSLERLTARSNARGLHESRIYLTDLDDEEGLDLCEIEEIKEQSCTSLMTDCQTEPRGHEVLTHVDLWDDEQHRFEQYMLARHNRCRASMEFDDVSGYKILLIGHRLGLIRAPN